MSTRIAQVHVLLTVMLVGLPFAPLTPHHAPPVAASGGLTRSSSPALSSCFRDDFTSTSVSPGWQFVDPLGDSNYQLSVHPSTLRVNVARGNHDFHYGYNTNAPRMMRQITGNFDVRTRVTTNPQYSYQSAGLTVWSSEQDFFWIGRAMYNLVQSLYEHSGQSGWWPTIKGVTATTIYLRIVRSDDTFSTYYSLDGSHWRSIGSTVYPAASQSVDVGMFVLSNWQENPFYADFDYFENVSQCSLPGGHPVKKVIVPGGLWIEPDNNFVVNGAWLHFAARAYPTHAGDPSIAYVNFTASWRRGKHVVWTTVCKANHPTYSDVYGCKWSLLQSNVPIGPLTVSFDVYDQAGNKNLSPHGTRRRGTAWYDILRQKDIKELVGLADGLKTIGLTAAKRARLLKPIAKKIDKIFTPIEFVEDALDLKDTIATLHDEPKHKAEVDRIKMQYGENSWQYRTALEEYHTWLFNNLPDWVSALWEPFWPDFVE